MQVSRPLKGSPTTQKMPLSLSTLSHILSSLDHSQAHDNYLFCAMICTGLYGLLHLGELSYPDNPHLHNPEISHHSSVTFPTAGIYAFILPCHKTDPFFEGSHIHIHIDCLFPFSCELWLCENGAVPTWSSSSSTFACIVTNLLLVICIAWG